MTVSTDETASVNNSGTPTDAVLDFVIPQGPAMASAWGLQTVGNTFQVGSIAVPSGDVIPYSGANSTVNNMTVVPNGLQATLSGTYYIQYKVNATYNQGAVLALCINDLPFVDGYLNISTGNLGHGSIAFFASVLTAIPANGILTVKNVGSSSLSIASGASTLVMPTTANLIAFRLGD